MNEPVGVRDRAGDHPPGWLCGTRREAGKVEGNAKGLARGHQLPGAHFAFRPEAASALRLHRKSAAWSGSPAPKELLHLELSAGKVVLNQGSAAVSDL
jgi:hypothetical protein